MILSPISQSELSHSPTSYFTSPLSATTPSRSLSSSTTTSTGSSHSSDPLSTPLDHQQIDSRLRSTVVAAGNTTTNTANQKRYLEMSVPLTKPKRRLSKVSSPSSPIRNSFSHHPVFDHHSSSSSSISTLHTRSNSHSNGYDYSSTGSSGGAGLLGAVVGGGQQQQQGQQQTLGSSLTNSPLATPSSNGTRDKDLSFGTSTAHYSACSPVITNKTFPSNFSSSSLNQSSPYLNNSHHQHQHKTLPYNPPGFPILKEDYEPSSSSGRSSSGETPIGLQRGFEQRFVEPLAEGRKFDRDDGLKVIGQDGNQGAGQGPIRIMGIDIKWISLMTLALQNAFLTIIMHYSRISTSPARSYSAASAVMLNELLKGSISLLTALKRVDNEMTREEMHLRSPVVKSRITTRSSVGENDSVSMMRNTTSTKILLFIKAYFKPDRWRRLGREIFSSDCWKLSIPAILYVIQNNLQYTAASNLDVATFQVTYQMKILTTAFFSVLMLGKRLSTSKWLALLLLAAGVGIVQIQSGAAGHAQAGSTTAAVVEAVISAGEKRSELEAAAKSVIAATVHEMYPLRGFLAVCAACMTSGLAGVYFEMVLKGSKADLWIRNVQLSLFSLVPAFLPILFGSSGNASGGLSGLFLEPFRNFSAWAWGTVLTQVFGGLVTALVIKYSDNILKGFATSLSIILSFGASVFLFNYHVTPSFVMGSSIVLSATFMYNQPANTKPNPLVAGLANKISEATGGRVSPTMMKSRTAVAVPGSPIPANAPIIGEPAKPSRTSSMVSLLGLGQSISRAPTPSYPNGLSRPSTPFLSALATPNSLSAYASTQSLASLAGGYNHAPPPHSNASSAYSSRSASGADIGGMSGLKPLSPTDGGHYLPRDRKISGKGNKDRPVLEVRTDLDGKLR